MQKKFTPEGIEVWVYSEEFVWFPSLGRGSYIEGKLTLEDIDALAENLATGPKVSRTGFCFAVPGRLDKSTPTLESYLMNLLDDLARFDPNSSDKR